MQIQLEPGVPVVKALPAPPKAKNSWTAPSNAKWPPGIAPKPSRLSVQRLEGTPTMAGVYTVTLEEADAYGNPSGYTEVLTITVAPPATVIPVPAAQGTEDGYVLPEVEGVRWIVDGAERPAGAYSVQPVTETTTVTITPEALDGYAFDAEPVPLVLTFEPAPAPAPEPEPEPEEPGDGPEEWGRLMDDDPQALFVARRLAERIIRHTGGNLEAVTADELVTAQDHALTVTEYVRGYTREQGFVGYIPHRSLQAVIVAAAARLYVNPEQITYYQTGDYSERPATMTGWTMAERAVLRRFRRVTA